MISSTPFDQHFRHCSWLVLITLCWCNITLALPEDANQQIEVQASSSELYLDIGLVIYRGTSTNPARITQGSLQIYGTEIRIERNEGALKKITATGTPARFQQQLEVDQDIIKASGLTLDFDNSAGILNIDVEAEFIQAGNTLSGHHIDYDMRAQRANATSRSDVEPVTMTILPQQP